MSHFSFLDMLRFGDIPPNVFGTPRLRVLGLLGTPSGWISRDDPIWVTPKRDYHTSDSFSYGSVTFSFDQRDELEAILQDLSKDEIAYPNGFLYFPTRETRVGDIAELMRGCQIAFEDISTGGEATHLQTESGVEIVGNNRPVDRYSDLLWFVLSKIR